LFWRAHPGPEWCRREKGRRIADRLGKPQSWLAKVEGCERRLDLAEFIALARAMDMEPAALFDEVLRGSGRADAAMRT